MEYLLIYILGGILGLIFWSLDFGDRVRCEKYPVIGLIFNTVLWPLLIPFSFLSLWVILSYLSLKLSLYIVSLVGGKFEVQGKEFKI